ncbi:MAG TPA: GFA family protein, partial [Acidimicrobiales bacterium]
MPACRRAPSLAWIVVRREHFFFTVGASAQFRSSPPVVRTFCGQCGTPLTYQHDDSPNTIDITTATLDAPEDFPPTREIWLEHRLSWEPLDEKLQHFQRRS